MNDQPTSQTFAPDKQHRPAGHPSVATGRVGVLLVNLGTPDGTDYKSMRRYLEEFLTDRRVIEWPRAYWYPILYGIVLNKRPQKVGKAYRSIWNDDRDESYLRTFTRSQAEKLTARLGGTEHTRPIEVDWAMRYGKPSIADKLNRLKDLGCERILWFPLYPQYAAATTATVNDKAFDALKTMRWQPAVRTVPPYHDDPAYIAALAQSIQTPTRPSRSSRASSASSPRRAWPASCSCTAATPPTSRLDPWPSAR